MIFQNETLSYVLEYALFHTILSALHLIHLIMDDIIENYQSICLMIASLLISIGIILIRNKQFKNQKSELYIKILGFTIPFALSAYFIFIDPFLFQVESVNRQKGPPPPGPNKLNFQQITLKLIYQISSNFFFENSKNNQLIILYILQLVGNMMMTFSIFFQFVEGDMSMMMTVLILYFYGAQFFRLIREFNILKNQNIEQNNSQQTQMPQTHENSDHQCPSSTRQKFQIQYTKDLGIDQINENMPLQREIINDAIPHKQKSSIEHQIELKVVDLPENDFSKQMVQQKKGTQSSRICCDIIQKCLFESIFKLDSPVMVIDTKSMNLIFCNSKLNDKISRYFQISSIQTSNSVLQKLQFDFDSDLRFILERQTITSSPYIERIMQKSRSSLKSGTFPQIEMLNSQQNKKNSKQLLTLLNPEGTSQVQSNENGISPNIQMTNEEAGEDNQEKSLFDEETRSLFYFVKAYDLIRKCGHERMKNDVLQLNGTIEILQQPLTKSNIFFQPETSTEEKVQYEIIAELFQYEVNGHRDSVITHEFFQNEKILQREESKEYNDQDQNFKYFGDNIDYQHIMSTHDQKTENLMFISINFREVKSVNQLKNQQLINSLSHELLTPLNQTLLFMQTAMMRSDVSLEIQQKIIFPTISSLRLNQYFSYDLLDYLSIEAGIPLKSDFILFSGREVIDQTFQLFQHMFKLKQIQLISLPTSKMDEKIYADYRRVMQVVINLITNALKSTHNGYVSLQTDLIEIEGKKVMSIQVRDSGNGMSETKITHLQKKLKDVWNQNKLQMNIIPDAGFGITVTELLLKRIAPETNNNLDFQPNLDSGDKKGISATFYVYDYEKYDNGISPSQSGMKFSYNFRSIGQNYSEVLSSPNKTPHNVPFSFSPNNNHAEDPGSNLPPAQSMKIRQAFSGIVKEDSASLETHIDMIHQNYNFDLLMSHIDQQKKIIRQITIQTSNQKQCETNQILYIDDEVYNLIALECLLEQFQITLLKASSYQEGKEILDSIYVSKENQPVCGNANCTCWNIKLIIMDVTMPMVNGCEATRRFQQKMMLQQYPDIPIVAYTGIDTQDTKDQCFEAGMDEFMNKPVNIQQMEEILHRFVYDPHTQSDIPLNVSNSI